MVFSRASQIWVYSIDFCDKLMTYTIYLSFQSKSHVTHGLATHPSISFPWRDANERYVYENKVFITVTPWMYNTNICKTKTKIVRTCDITPNETTMLTTAIINFILLVVSNYYELKCPIL